MILFIIFITQANANASRYGYKHIDEFPPLNFYATVEEFEASYQGYVQDCLDNTGGGTGGIPCFIGNELWDRELNNYYGKLKSLLNEKEASALRESQRTWIKERDLSIKFNSMLLDRKYSQQGTMFALMRAGAADKAITPIVKQRALVLKSWYDSIKK